MDVSSTAEGGHIICMEEALNFDETAMRLSGLIRGNIDHNTADGIASDGSEWRVATCRAQIRIERHLGVVVSGEE